jgi:hypothetical protein
VDLVDEVDLVDVHLVHIVHKVHKNAPTGHRRIIQPMRPLALTLLLCAFPAWAQHDITQVEPVAERVAMATPIPMKRGWKKYDIPDLAGAQQVIGSQLIDGRLRKPLVDFITSKARSSSASRSSRVAWWSST